MDMSRRNFLGATATAVIAAGTVAKGKVFGANDRVRIAVAGINGRGEEHISGFNGLANAEVAVVCDVDKDLFGKKLKKYYEGKSWKQPTTAVDIRKVLEDKSIDAISIATPNHWHSLMAIWACQAGKDVYVEKPCSHNVWEGRRLVEAAKKYKRVVQHGTQIRSNPSIRKAIQLLNEGVIGEVYMARGLCYRWRDTIGTGKPGTPPPNLDWNLWQGPAEERPYMVKEDGTGLYVPYNWHWTWHYGNGDIGNQGVHQMDLARWGLGVGLPKRVTSMGRMVLFDDAKEVPNVTTSAFDFPDAGKKGKMMTFEVRPWSTNDEQGAKVGVIFYGEKGYMVIDSYEHFAVYLGKDGKKEMEGEEEGNHFQNFVDVVRSRDVAALNAPIEEGHLSAALSHLGLISARVGRTLEVDPEKETIIGDEEAAKFLKRNYRQGFEVPEAV